MKSDSRGTLIEAGTRLFAERGLSGVGVRELSRAAGVSISMISYHFGGKEGLYAAVLSEQFSCFEQVEEIRGRAGDPVAGIEGYLRWTIRRHRSHPQLLRFYTSELTNPTPFFSTIVSPAVGKVIRTLAEMIGDGARRGRFRAGVNPVAAATALAGMINYHFLSTPVTRELGEGRPLTDEDIVQEYLAVFLKGIADRLPGETR